MWVFCWYSMNLMLNGYSIDTFQTNVCKNSIVYKEYLQIKDHHPGYWGQHFEGLWHHLSSNWRRHSEHHQEVSGPRVSVYVWWHHNLCKPWWTRYGYGCGGENGNKDLHKHIRHIKTQQKECKQLLQSPRGKENKLHPFTTFQYFLCHFKCGQQSVVVGVLRRTVGKFQDKFWEADSLGEREAIYQKHRAAPMKHLRTSSRLIERVVFHFFDDPIYLKKMQMFKLTQVEC